jgi:ClpP class serine protease
MLSDVMAVRDVVDALDRAGDDSHVAGLVATIGASSMGLAKTQEIRDAVLRFRAKKKFAVAFSETFGEAGPGQKAYYLATAFDQIYLQPSGDTGLTGIMFESPFLKDTFGKLGMRFHGDHRYEYKSALNTFTETKYTPAEREENQRLITAWYGQELRGIAEARGHMGSDTVTAAFRAAVRDKDVKAIIFRIESPGGSYVASDSVWRKVVKGSKAGSIASMQISLTRLPKAASCPCPRCSKLPRAASGQARTPRTWASSTNLAASIRL